MGEAFSNIYAHVLLKIAPTNHDFLKLQWTYVLPTWLHLH